MKGYSNVDNRFRGTAKSLFWTLYGSTVWNPALPSTVCTILFVCKGNICRSPFAEHMAKKIIEKYSSKSKSYDIYSAGIHVEEQKNPPSEAIVSAKRFGIELQEHKSRSINYNLLESSDMVLVMETGQYKLLRKLFVEFRSKIYLLPLVCSRKEQRFSGYQKYNIQDPYGKSMEHYYECFRRIEMCISVMLSDTGIIPANSRS